MLEKTSRRSLLRLLGLAPGLVAVAKAQPELPLERPREQPPAAPAPTPTNWLNVGPDRWIPLFVVALFLAIAGGASSCSSPADASPLQHMVDQVDAGDVAPNVVALAKVNDAGQLVRSFNVIDSVATGDDANFTVKVTLGPVPSLDRLYALATLSDARSGFTLDLGQNVGGPVFVDLAVEPDHSSGFYLAIFASP